MKLRWHIKFEIATGLVGLLPVIDPRRWERAAVAFAVGDRGSLSPEMARPCRFPRLLGSSVGEALGLTVVNCRASRPEDLDAAFAAAAGDRNQAMVVQFVALTFEERWRITALAAHFRLPAVYLQTEAENGQDYWVRPGARRGLSSARQRAAPVRLGSLSRPPGRLRREGPYRDAVRN